MSLINCQECGKEISDKATSCPNCGCPVLKYNNCILCGSLTANEDNVCDKCKKDYEITTGKISEESMIDNEAIEKTKANTALITSIVLPPVGFILGIIYSITLKNKTKPILSIFISIAIILFAFLYWYPIIKLI